MSLGSEYILIMIDGARVEFSNTAYGAVKTSIEGLALSKAGVEKEFPDLVGDVNWRNKAIARFKEKIELMNSERERADYLIDDLKKVGYKPLKMQIKGFRPQNIK